MKVTFIGKGCSACPFYKVAFHDHPDLQEYEMECTLSGDNGELIKTDGESKPKDCPFNKGEEVVVVAHQRD